MREFSEIAKHLREQKHLTQTQLAQKLWVQKSIISAYETGARQPSLDMLIKYAHEFHVSTDYLLGMDSTPSLQTVGLTDEQRAVLSNLIFEFQKANKA